LLAASGSDRAVGVGVVGPDREDGLAEAAAPITEDGVTELTRSAAGVVRSVVVDFETSPCASMASRAALSFAFLARSNTSSCI
jgi:hypothetical protein